MKKILAVGCFTWLSLPFIVALAAIIVGFKVISIMFQ